MSIFIELLEDEPVGTSADDEPDVVVVVVRGIIRSSGEIRVVVLIDLTSAAANTVGAAKPRDCSASIVRECWIIDLATETETVVEGLSRALSSDAVCRSFAASKDGNDVGAGTPVLVEMLMELLTELLAKSLAEPVTADADSLLLVSEDPVELELALEDVSGFDAVVRVSGDVVGTDCELELEAAVLVSDVADAELVPELELEAAVSVSDEDEPVPELELDEPARSSGIVGLADADKLVELVLDELTTDEELADGLAVAELEEEKLDRDELSVAELDAEEMPVEELADDELDAEETSVEELAASGVDGEEVAVDELTDDDELIDEDELTDDDELIEELLPVNEVAVDELTNDEPSVDELAVRELDAEELTEDELTEDDVLTDIDELIEELLPVNAVAVDELTEELMLLLLDVVVVVVVTTTAGGSFASLLAPTKLFPLEETV
ncbi:hypothetical protein Q7P35_011958 [Cladosporium inversicolor]